MHLNALQMKLFMNNLSFHLYKPHKDTVCPVYIFPYILCIFWFICLINLFVQNKYKHIFIDFLPPEILTLPMIENRYISVII